jgi:ABC-type antimicrobial peptide transport system permease subunit
VPNPATRFKEFAAGGMIADPESNDAVVDEDFVKAFGFADPNAAVGQTIDFLAPRDEGGDDQPNIMGMPLGDDRSGDADGENPDDGTPKPDALVAKSFRIVGVLKTTDAQGQRKFRGLMPTAPVYIALPAIRSWRDEHRDNLGEIALELARQNGSIKEGESAGYTSAVVRVEDPGALPAVRKRIGEKGLGSFSILDQLEQLRLIFLIINSVLGLLGGISLLVASFGIANTMIMSILERTREIGIMKAIGAEDREIKLIFFVEAAVIGWVGGCIGCLIALGIEVLANRLTYRFALKPQGASFVDFFAMPPYLWGSAIVFAVLIAVAAALYPAARAARIDPIKALRHD